MAIKSDIYKDGEYWAWTVVSTREKSYYEELGYEVPSYYNRRKRQGVKKGTKILIKIKDLLPSSDVEVTKICDECGEVSYNHKHINIVKSRERIDGKDRCNSCSLIYRGQSKKTNVPYEKSAEYYCKNNGFEYLLGEFSDKNNREMNEIFECSNEKFWWNCSKCNEEYYSVMNKRTAKTESERRGCPYCTSHKINIKNCMATTRPDIAKLLWNQEDGEKYFAYSGKKVDWKCLDCGLNIKNKIIQDISNHGLSCPRCSDGVSYPEKFMFNFLTQSGGDFEYQKTFDWSLNRRYDFYIPSLNCIIEVHGLQHYNNIGFRPNGEEQKIDEEKKILAENNKITHYIIINCSQSDIQFIKTNILNSDLSKLCNLTKIDWLKCHEHACISLVRVACDLWNGEIRGAEGIGEKMKLSRVTVRRYLKQGAKLGWCDYNPEVVRLERGKKNIELAKLIESNKNTDFHILLIKKICDLWNEGMRSTEKIGEIMKFDKNVIRKYLKRGEKLGLCDYDPNEVKTTLGIRASETRKRTIVRVTLNGEYLDEFDSASEAALYFKIQRSHISSVCNGKRKSSGGFKWMFKEEYEKMSSAI